jgi:DNA-binding helix-hairpin-helix protein with protein kinase domain
MPGPSLVDQHGRALRLGKTLGRGGEAEIFDVEGTPGAAAKLYHQPRSAAQLAKLAHLVGRATPELLRIAAWPTATLHERAGAPARGFLMSKVEGFAELHVLYGLKSRRERFPRADWHFLIHVAMNCAAAFDSLHEAGVVIADVNSRNLFVSPKDATVRFVDCDSFQLTTGEERFPCDVGVPEYTPPELQGKPFAGIVRTANHDRFGLAVLVFQLLFMGRHPFFGRYIGAGEMSQERAIQELRFAFGRSAEAVQMRAPPHSVPLSLLPAPVAELFERAFSEQGVRGGRPGAHEWHLALQQLGAQLQTCRSDSSHRYPEAARRCPWCDVMESGGPLYFAREYIPLRFLCSVSEISSLVVDVEQALRLPALASPPAAPAVEATPLPPAASRSQTLLQLWSGLGLATLAAFLTAACVAVAAPAAGRTQLTGSLGVAVVMILGWRLRFDASSAWGVERAARRRALAAARQERAACDQLLQRLVHSIETAQREGLDEQARIVNQYSSLQARFEIELDERSRAAGAAQRAAWLKSQRIVEAQIPGVDVTKKTLLFRAGIRSALDVLQADLMKLAVIGPVPSGLLLTWATSIEGKFRFYSSKRLPEAEQRALFAQYRREQTALRAQLELLVRTSSVRMAPLAVEREALQRRAHAADARLLKARADTSLELTAMRRIVLAMVPPFLVSWILLLGTARSKPT